MKLSLKTCSKNSLIVLPAILYLFFVSFQINAQNALILNGAYIIETGGTATNNIHIVIDQPDTLGIVRLSTGGHIHSESQYNFVTWHTGTNTGSYVFPFGVGGNIAEVIPFTFNKTAGNSTISISTWATDQQNNPKPEHTNVAAVTNMNGITDSVLYAIDRFWDIQAPSTTADLIFSYRGIENTTTSPTDLIQAQHWNGSLWDTPVGPGTNGVTSGIGTAGVFTGQNTFSPWVLVTTPTTYNVTINPSICQGDIFVVGSNSYTISGTYVDTLINSFGCDSIITTNLTVNPISTNNISATICHGDNFVVGSNSYTVSGTYVDTLINNFGCDSIITTNLTVNPISTNNISATICHGDNFVVGSNSYTVSGTYVDTLINSFGCDSIITTNLTVNPISTNNISATICEGDNYIVGSNIYTLSGIYVDTLLNSFGCDSIITTNLSVNATFINNFYATICQGDSYVVGSNSYTISGTYVDTLINSFGCDSIISTNLNVHSLPNIQVISLKDVLCFGDMTGEIEVAATGSISPQFVWINHGISGVYIKDLSAGVYNLEVTDVYSCKSDTSLIVSQPSELNLDYEIGHPSCIVYNNGYVEFEVTGGVSPYLYSCELGESDSSYFSNLYEGEYNFVIRDDNNCIENVTIILNDNPNECLSIPTAFTPNGDGINDIWIIENIDLFEYYALQVFNRWGQEMYSGRNGIDPWNGRYMNNGKKVPTGSYVYVIKIDDGKNNQSGIVTVVY